ncbi:hypothetical protein PIB30_062263 [Stylosanthes scabra]|uniref:Uncharacterized protein n=1 Tax=Stylosanthes scabra TaxID=79078 RepID=A0ABU6ZJU4_9FABA|nr:hypothetical protein [Stylosanthes scabra]
MKKSAFAVARVRQRHFRDAPRDSCDREPLTLPLFLHHRHFPKIACENLPTAVTTVLFPGRRRWCCRAASVLSVLYPGCHAASPAHLHLPGLILLSETIPA